MCLFLSWCEEVLRFGDVDLSNAPTLFVSFHHIYAVKLYQNFHDRDINLCKRFCNTLSLFGIYSVSFERELFGITLIWRA